MSKGSGRRPAIINHEEFGENFDRIFESSRWLRQVMEAIDDVQRIQ